MVNLDRIPVVLSPNRTVVGSPARRLDVIVIHDMEWTETDQTAEACAAYFAKPTTKASAHYLVDRNSIVQCVPLADVAWAAPGNNHNGIQIEFAGYARQTAQEWADAYSTGMLDLGAGLVAALCKRHGIPIKFLDAAALKRGERGITTHAEVSKAWKKSNHTDPGANFPMQRFLADVLAETAKLNPPKPVVVTFQIVNNGKVLAESDPVEGKGVAAERVRLDGFLNNRTRLIHATLITDPDSTLQLKRKVTT